MTCSNLALLDRFIDFDCWFLGYDFTSCVHVPSKEMLEIRRRTVGMENLETLVAAHNLVPCCGEENNCKTGATFRQVTRRPLGGKCQGRNAPAERMLRRGTD